MIVEKIGVAMSWSVLAKIARFSAGLISSIIIIRILGEGAWGTFSILKTIKGLAMVIISLGAGNAILKFIPQSRVKGGLDEVVGSFLKLTLLQLAVWISLIMVVRFRSDWISALFGGDSDRFGFLLQVAVALVIFEIFFSLLTKVMQSFYSMRMLAIATVTGKAGYILLLILFIKMGSGILGILIAGAVVNTGMSLIVLPEIIKILRSWSGYKGLVPGPGTLLGFSLPFVATGLLNQIVWRRSEVLFLGHYHDATLAGYFSLAYDIPQMLLEFIPLTIWPIIMAGTSEVYSRDNNSLPDAINVYYRLLFILVIPVAVIGFVFVSPFIPIVYGDTMIPASHLAQLFFIVFSYSFIYTPLSMSLYVMGKSWVNMLIFTLMAVLNIGLDFALIPHYGIWGAFIPVAFVLGLGVVLFQMVIRRFNRNVKPPFGFILRCYLAGLPAALLAISTAEFNTPGGLLLQLPLAFVLLFFGFKVMKIIGEREKELILKLPLPLKERIVSLF